MSERGLRKLASAAVAPCARCELTVPHAFVDPDAHSWDPNHVTVHPADMLGLLARLDAAEQVCLMVGWSAGSDTERGKAMHELWVAWLRLFEEAGGSGDPRRHPELSDERIRFLADRRDDTRRALNDPVPAAVGSEK